MRDVPYARQHRNAFIFQDGQCKRPSCVCCSRSPAVLQSHDSPMASEVCRPVSKVKLNIYRTPLGDMSGDGLRSHRTSMIQRAHWCTPGGMVLDSQSNPWVAHQKHKASLSRTVSEWRPYSLMYWPLPNSKLGSSQGASLKTLLLMINVLCQYHFDDTTWK